MPTHRSAPHTSGTIAPPQDTALAGSQRRLLYELRREGPQTLPQLARRLGVSTQTVREHVHRMIGRGIVEPAGTHREGPGRPGTLFALTERGIDLFPNQESAILEELVEDLEEHGHHDALRDFFDRRGERIRQEAERRLEGLSGRERLEELVRFMRERGFVARLSESETELPRLCLCHCPLRHVVRHSDLPCRAESRFLEAIIGGQLQRETWMPGGDGTCTYRLGAKDSPPR